MVLHFLQQISLIILTDAEGLFTPSHTVGTAVELLLARERILAVEELYLERLLALGLAPSECLHLLRIAHVDLFYLLVASLLEHYRDIAALVFDAHLWKLFRLLFYDD